MDWSFRLHCISFSLAITGPGLLVNSALAQRADRFAGTREAMVEQFIVAEGIDNEPPALQVAVDALKEGRTDVLPILSANRE